MPRWTTFSRRLPSCLILALISLTAPAQTPAPPDGDAGVGSQRAALLRALEEPMRLGHDVSVALTCWFKAERPAQPLAPGQQLALYNEGIASLAETKPLPPADWQPAPDEVEFTFHETLNLRDLEQIECRIVEFKVNDLQQYGVSLHPKREGQFPLIVYCHGAAYGVPFYSLPWLAELADRGYAVVAPAMRGEKLFAAAYNSPIADKYTCAGEIENLLGEPDDVLAMVHAAYAQPWVKPGKFAIIGHSFGAGAGLLAAARAGDRVACVVSYDAWFTNPFTYYWDRLRRGANNWLSWEPFTKLPVPEQMTGLKARSIVHNADRLAAPLLLFIGGGYQGSVFHRTHADLTASLEALGKPFRYVVVPEGGHNFVLYYGSEPAKYALEIQTAWLQEHHPPAATRSPAPDAAPDVVPEP